MKSDYTNPKQEIIFGNDNIVIQKFVSGIKGGRTLDTTNCPLTLLPSGLVVYKGKGDWKPFPLTTEKQEDGSTKITYGSVGSDDSVEQIGILQNTISAGRPVAAIMISGDVNKVAMPAQLTDAMVTLFRNLTQINFIQDEEA